MTPGRAEGRVWRRDVDAFPSLPPSVLTQLHIRLPNPFPRRCPTPHLVVLTLPDSTVTLPASTVDGPPSLRVMPATPLLLFLKTPPVSSISFLSPHHHQHTHTSSMSTSAPSSANYHTALSLISCINTYDFDAARAFLSPSFVYRGQPNNKEEMGINQVQVVIEGLLKARVPRIGVSQERRQNVQTPHVHLLRWLLTLPFEFGRFVQIELVNPLLVVEGKNGEIVLHVHPLPSLLRPSVRVARPNSLRFISSSSSFFFSPSFARQLKSHGAILGSPTDERYEMSYLMIFQFDGEGGKIVSLDEFLVSRQRVGEGARAEGES